MIPTSPTKVRSVSTLQSFQHRTVSSMQLQSLRCNAISPLLDSSTAAPTLFLCTGALHCRAHAIENAVADGLLQHREHCFHPDECWPYSTSESQVLTVASRRVTSSSYKYEVWALPRYLCREDGALSKRRICKQLRQLQPLGVAHPLQTIQGEIQCRRIPSMRAWCWSAPLTSTWDNGSPDSLRSTATGTRFGT